MNKRIKNRIDQIKNGQVPEGYKKTDFGVFPNDWEIAKLKRLGVFSRGKGLPGTAWKEKGLPCIGYGDIYMKYDTYFNTAQSYVDYETAKGSQPIEKGTLLFTGTGETDLEIGKCVCYNGNEVIYAGGDILLFNSHNLHPLFIAYQQNTEFAIKQKARFAQGHSVVHIQIDNLKKLNIAYPKSHAEQEKIAKILMLWDKAIDIQEQLLQKLNLQKKALMQILLTPKDGWKTFKLKELVDTLTSGATPSTRVADYYNGEIVWVSIDDITKAGKYIASSSKRITKKGMEDSLAKMFPKSTVLFAMYASIGKTVITLKECTTSQAILGIIANPNKIFHEFLYYYLINLQGKMATLGQRGTQANLNKSIVANFNMKLPFNNGEIDIKYQCFIANILSLSDKQITAQQQKLELLKKQRKSLMQLLLTGIVRVVIK